MSNPNTHSTITSNASQNTLQVGELLLLKDQYRVPNVRIKVANHAEVMPIQSKKFDYHISKPYFDSTEGRKVAGSESVNNAIRVLHAQALFSGQEWILGLSTEYLREISEGQDNAYMVDYFMRIKDKINLDKLRFY